MKISELQVENVKHYLRLTETSKEDDAFLSSILKAAKKYISGQTNLQDTEIDEYSDLTIAVLIICQDMYDNRSMYVDKTNLNKTVDSILSMHRDSLVK